MKIITQHDIQRLQGNNDWVQYFSRLEDGTIWKGTVLDILNMSKIPLFIRLSIIFKPEISPFVMTQRTELCNWFKTNAPNTTSDGVFYREFIAAHNAIFGEDQIDINLEYKDIMELLVKNDIKYPIHTDVIWAALAYKSKYIQYRFEGAKNTLTPFGYNKWSSDGRLTYIGAGHEADSIIYQKIEEALRQ